MKIILFLTTLLFINFEVKAKDFSVEQMYEYCSIWKNNGFNIGNLDELNQFKATVCMAYIGGISDKGWSNCVSLNISIDTYQKQYNTNEVGKRYNKVIKLFVANIRISAKQAVLSFINYAEKNPNQFKYSAVSESYNYLGKIFPCKLKYKIY